ncbi:zinc-dependent metalloprotease [Candidatus Cloacimonadota bacterium]
MRYNFDKDNSYYNYLKSFPMNTEIDVILHYYNNEGTGAYTLPDSRSMLHKYHYSISTLPENNYRPRVADDRIGFFNTIYQDYSDLNTDSPYIRYINRWHLEKEKSGKKISKVKEPIVFWLENTIPEKYRDAVKEGILAWNDAFEEAGFKNAVVAKVMPDDADWDPADSRYNTIRWIVQPGGGYAVGPSHVNPYTGQIYDADVRISVDFLRYYYREFEETIEPTGWIDALRSAQWEETDISYLNYREVISQSDWMGAQLGLGVSALNSRDIFSSGRINEDEFVELGIKDLVMHEVGHTLGLRHNFKASTSFSPQELQDKDFTKDNGVTTSIMDYTPINLSPVDGDQGSYFQGQPGAWDRWVIAYGYTPIKEDKEEEKLQEIASRCTEPLLVYGTDEDAFGMSTRGVDPTCNIFDLSNDPIEFYNNRIDIAHEIWDNLFTNFEKKGESYKKLLYVFSQGLGEYNSAAHNISKNIGGLYTYRDHIGDPDGRPPFQIVPAEQQRRAMNFLTEKILAADAFDFSPELLNKLVYEKMGTFTGSVWSRSRLDYPIHSRVSRIQAIVLSHLYDPLVLNRLVDNQLRFSESEEPFTIDEMFQLMDECVWQELYNSSNINSFRRELQRIHTYRLIELLLEERDSIPQDASALARYHLANVEANIKELDQAQLDRMTVVHLLDISDQIDKALKADYK